MLSGSAESDPTAARVSRTWRTRESEWGARALGTLLSKGRRSWRRRSDTTSDRVIHFASESGTLSTGALKTLDAVERQCRECRELEVVVGGFASRGRTRQSEMRLALRRIRAIRRHLYSCGVDPRRVSVAVRGEGWAFADEPVHPGGNKPAAARLYLRVEDPTWTLSRN